MYGTLFNIVRPFLQSFLTKRAAEYAAKHLQERREKRLQKPEETIEEPQPESISETTALPPEPAVEFIVPPAAEAGEVESDRLPSKFSWSDTFWYTLAGIFLGTAFSLMINRIIKEEE